MTDPEEHKTKTDEEIKNSNSENEDVEIDFSKITGMFRKKKEPDLKPEHHVHSHKEKDDDEIDIGKAVSGIKNIFKRGGKGSADEDSLDLAAAYSFVKKNYLIILTIIGVLVSVGLGMSIRLDAGDLAFTENWARNSIDTTLRNDVSSFVQQAYPNLPNRNREALVAEELGKAYSTGTYTFKTGQYQGQTINIEQQVGATSQVFKEFFQDNQGRNYMPDIDPYYWLRYTQNIIEKGHVGDEVRDGLQFDNHQFAPVGRGIAPQDTFYPKAIASFHKVAKPIAVLLGKDSSLERTIMFFPVFIMAMTSLVVYLLTRRIAGSIAAFFAATMVGVHVSLMSRTMFGHADSDALIVFFSVLVLWLFIESFAATNIKWKSGWAVMAGVATGLYSLAWGGWWWIFDFIMAASVGTIGLYVAYEIFNGVRKGKKNVVGLALSALKENATRKAITTTAIYFLVTGLLVIMFTGLRNFILTPIASIGFRTIKTPVVDTSLPNVLRTVAELNEGTVQQAINQIGSSLFYIAVLGIILIIARAAIEALKRERDHNKVLRDLFFAAVLTLWFVATLYAVTKGIRFTLLLVPAFSIAFGAVFGMVAGYTSQWMHKEFKFNKLATTALVFLLLMLIFPGLTFNSNVVQVSKNTVRNDIPLVNDAWHNALTAIKDNSQPNAIITSWWDFGHHFKQIADRAVTFDGTTQGSPQAHWVGRFFSTDNEKEAVGILRMLNCGAQSGTETLRQIRGDNVIAMLITKRIILLDRDEARNVLLEEELSEEQADDVLQKTHCNPPESFVIASEDMIGKSGVWGHFGGWNFTKADIWKATRSNSRQQAVEYMTSKFEMTNEEANSIFDQIQPITDDRTADAWISPWPGFSGGTDGCGVDVAQNVTVCGDGLIVNLTDHNAWYPTAQGNLHPRSIAYLTPDGKVAERKFENNTVPQELSVLLVPSGNGYFKVLASPQLVDGIFARMFYLQGHDLNYFKLLTRERGFIGTDIYVWQVDWNGEQENIIPELKPQPPVEEKTTVSEGDEVTLNYIGYLEDGTVFDSSITGFREKGVSSETHLDENNDYSPITFTTGQGEVIPGFEQGVIGTGRGDEKQITVPPELGYIADPSHPLFNKTIYFKIKVESIK